MKKSSTQRIVEAAEKMQSIQRLEASSRKVKGQRYAAIFQCPGCLVDLAIDDHLPNCWFENSR